MAMACMVAMLVLHLVLDGHLLKAIFSEANRYKSCCPRGFSTLKN